MINFFITCNCAIHFIIIMAVSHFLITTCTISGKALYMVKGHYVCK